jgi:MFS family permease
VLVVAGLLLSASLVRETHGYAREEERQNNRGGASENLSATEVFRRTTFSDPNLSSATQAGLATNLKDGMAWGLFPLFFGAAGMSLKQIGVLTALYPAVWGILQLATGSLSDRIGRKRLIYSGMWVQAAALAWIASGSGFWWFAAGAAILGVGTAMVYPVLLAAVSDSTEPLWRGSALGVFRLWRDAGYAAGAVAAGVLADYLGMQIAFWLIAALTFGSGLVVLGRMRESR